MSSSLLQLQKLIYSSKLEKQHLFQVAGWMQKKVAQEDLFICRPFLKKALSLLRKTFF